MSVPEGFDILGERLKKLERKMFSNGSHYGDYPEVVTTLSDLSTKMDGILSSRDRMMAVMKRSEELNDYLDPCYISSSSQLSDGEMTDLLLAQTGYFEQQNDALDRYNAFKPVLESKHIADTMDLTSKFAEVSLKQNELEHMSEEQSEQVTDFTQSYNSILKAVSETLLNMEEMITKLEIAALPKKTTD